MQSIDPATGAVLAEYPEHDAAAIESRLRAGVAAQAAWAERPPEERAAPLRRAAALLREERDRHAGLMTGEMGKPLAQAAGEVDKCAWVLEHYADTAAQDLAPERGPTDFESWIRFDPLGLVLAIMPWNFPYWQVFRFAAPTLAAGNGAILKHAENVTGSALAIEDVLARSGFPDGLFATVITPVEDVPRLIADDRIAGVTLTGSTRAGASVAAEAGRCLKPTVLELGGSDPYLVLEDADLDRAVETTAASRLLNSGQSCIAAKRFIVVEPVRAEFEARLVERFRRVKMGPPREDGTEVGPLAREDLRDTLARQVATTRAAGAKAPVGGERPEGPGWFYPPTVLTDVPPGSPAWDEELFGPVAAVIGAADEDEAVRIANGSSYGLGAGVFTRDRARADRVAARLQVGAVAVNDFVRSDPRLPFGGVKRSGYGRELSVFGLRAFVNVKTVTVAGEAG